MKRGEIWTVSGGSRYAGKPRPAVIVQEDRFSGTDSVTLCVFTSDPTAAPLLRMDVEPSDINGLQAPCRLMIDNVTTVPKTRLGRKVGRLDDDDMLRLNRSLIVFLGLAGPVPRTVRRADQEPVGHGALSAGASVTPGTPAGSGPAHPSSRRRR